MPIGMELTTRQKVAKLREKGLSVRQIARELDITTQAVYQHLQNLDKGPGQHSPRREVAS